MLEKKDRATRYTGDMIPGIKLPSGEITPGTRSKRTLRLRNAIVAASFELEGKRVLDVGCAEGRQTLALADRALEVFGVDHRASQVQIGRNTAAALGMKNVRFEAADVRDPDLFGDAGKFDLAIAWGFLHRIGDIYSLLYSLEPITNAISLEWRTPVLPLMSEMSLAYHPQSSQELDPMNTGRSQVEGGAAADDEKIEGNASFWEPTPGAVKTIMRRLGYTHATLLGYEDDLVPESTIMRRWHDHEAAVKAGKRKPTTLPQARVHMLFEKVPNSIRLVSPEEARRRLPAWDQALLDSTNGGRHPASVRHSKNPPPGTPALRRLAKAVLSRLGLGWRFSNGGRSRSKKTSGKKASAPKESSKGHPYVVDKEALAITIETQAPSVFADALQHASGDPGLVGDAGIQLSSLKLSDLSVVIYSSTQLAMRTEKGNPLPRALFRDDTYYYKVWRHDYIGHRELFLAGRRKVLPAAQHDGVERLWAFHVGLFDEATCPAFAGGIYSGTKLVGYRTLVGQPIEHFDVRNGAHAEFARRLGENTLNSGYVYSDLRTPNLVELADGRLSLIDFDGNLLMLHDFLSGIRTGYGFLRPKTIKPYLDLLKDFAKPRRNQTDLLAARARAEFLPKTATEADVPTSLK